MPDILLGNLSHKFISGFQTFCKVEKNHQHNTSVKYVKNLKAILNKGVLWEWIDKNPFTGYKTPEKRIYKDFLTTDELAIIEGKTFDVERIEAIKNVFLFQCYTGLSYSDISSITRKDIREFKDLQWVWKDRNKTGVPIRVPLSEKALKLVNLEEETIIKVPTNQKCNAYLKEIADMCGIKKNLTTHMARRTFATLTLAQGVSIESVAGMLGHDNITVTQKHYSRVIPEKILLEMRIVLGIRK